MKKPLVNILLTLSIAGGLIVSAAANARSVYEGRKLFNTYCYVCHGVEGKGDGPLAIQLQPKPTNLTDHSRMGSRTDRQLTRIIKHGGGHGLVSKNMPKWGGQLAPTQIQSLVSYVRFLHKSKHPLLGAPELGKQVYARYCATCHGEDGRGKGVMTKVINITPADHTDADTMDKLSNNDLIMIITHGGKKAKRLDSLMPAWQGILAEDEIKGIVSYLRLLSH